jgi:TonB family protein
MNAIAQALSAALLEFVWQGLLAAFLLWSALFVLRNRSARARYAASCAALAVMAVLPVLTACLMYAAPASWHASRGSAVAATGIASAAIPAAAASSAKWASSLMRWAAPLWSLGVLLFSLRLVWAGRQISALRRRSKPAEAAVLAVVAAIRERMKLARPVRVLISAAADCPSVVGWIKPVVLLPAATVMGLTPQQLEAVLAHELAHILRDDYLVNMLQTVAETLLFYHPAVWWASARIRHERELCCDDLAVDSCGDALCYARALTRLERLRASTPRLALGSAGGSLMYRIQRLAGDAGGQRGPSKLPGVLALSLGLICFAMNMQWARGQQPDAPPPEPGVRVDLGGASVVHRAEVEYPDAAIEKGVQGTVVLETMIDADGSVGDARVLSGPRELRRAALQSVLQWHFTRAAAGSTRQVSIAFQLPAEGGAARSAKRERDRVQAQVQKQLAESMAEQAIILRSRPSADASELETEAKLLAEAMAKAGAEHDFASADLAESLAHAAQTEDLESQLQALSNHAAAVAGIDSALAAAQASQSATLESRLADLQAGLTGFHGAAMFAGRRLQTIDIQGLAAASRDELLAKLPVHVGDTLAEDSMEKVQQAVTQFDEHLSLSMFTNHDGQVEIRIAAP